MGELSSQIGWNKGELVQKLEAKREEQASEWFQRKEKMRIAVEKEVDSISEVQKLRKELKQYGY